MAEPTLGKMAQQHKFCVADIYFSHQPLTTEPIIQSGKLDSATVEHLGQPDQRQADQGVGVVTVEVFK